MEVVDYGVQVLIVNLGLVVIDFFKKVDLSGEYMVYLLQWFVIVLDVLVCQVWDNVGYEICEINVLGYMIGFVWVYQIILGFGDWVIKKFFNF